MKQNGAALIVGADGLIGRALADHLRQLGERVLETSRRPGTISGAQRLFLDLAADVASWQIPDGVSIAYICAAVTSLECCRREPIESAKINVNNTAALARELASRGVFVVFPSTNLVYDGSIPFRQASDPVCPQTEYGRQKAEAEKQLLALGKSVSIVRLAKVLASNMPLFSDWIQRLRCSQTIQPFSDMVIAPVSLSFVTNVLYRVGEDRVSGIVQVSGERDVTYEQIARHIAERTGVAQNLIQPIKSEAAGSQLESVPAYTTLDMTRLRTEFGIKPPEVWLTIDTVFGL
jgi:dTDP-4-dehydrorhamnose reductase